LKSGSSRDSWIAASAFGLLAMTGHLAENCSRIARYFGAESHGDGTPTRMSREKSGD
jgi:hypothetical protein